MPTLSAVQSSCAFVSPHSLDQALQRELAAWAALEADHCSACRWLDEWSGPKAVKEPVARRLEARHRAEREAHLLRLADLHHRRMVLAMAGEAGEPTDDVVDWECRRVRCPEGHESTTWGQTRDKASGRSLIRVGFSLAQCQPCSSRPRCTQGISRWLGLRPRPLGERRRPAGSMPSVKGSRVRSRKACARSACARHATVGWPRQACRTWRPPRPSTLIA